MGITTDLKPRTEQPSYCKSLGYHSCSTCAEAFCPAHLEIHNLVHQDHTVLDLADYPEESLNQCEGPLMQAGYMLEFWTLANHSNYAHLMVSVLNSSSSSRHLCHLCGFGDANKAYFELPVPGYDKTLTVGECCMRQMVKEANKRAKERKKQDE